MCCFLSNHKCVIIILTITFRGSSSFDGRGSGWPKPKDARIRMALVGSARQGLSTGGEKRRRQGIRGKKKYVSSASSSSSKDDDRNNNADVTGVEGYVAEATMAVKRVDSPIYGTGRLPC